MAEESDSVWFGGLFSRPPLAIYVPRVDINVELSNRIVGDVGRGSKPGQYAELKEFSERKSADLRIAALHQVRANLRLAGGALQNSSVQSSEALAKVTKLVDATRRILSKLVGEKPASPIPNLSISSAVGLIEAADEDIRNAIQFERGVGGMDRAISTETAKAASRARMMRARDDLGHITLAPKR